MEQLALYMQDMDRRHMEFIQDIDRRHSELLTRLAEKLR